MFDKPKMLRGREYSISRDIIEKNIIEEVVWYYYNVNYQTGVAREENKEIGHRKAYVKYLGK